MTTQELDTPAPIVFNDFDGATADDMVLSVFNNFTSADLTDMDRRHIALMHVDDEMYGWINRLEAWGETDALANFQAHAYIVQLHLKWFELTRLVKVIGTRAEWTKVHLKTEESTRFLVLMKQFKKVFAYFETLKLPMPM